MSFRTRLLLTSLVTLAVGLGALLVLGNVLLDRRVESEVSDRLRAHAQAEVAGLDVTASGVRVRETANDQELDKGAWLFRDGRALDRPAGAAPDLEAAAVALSRSDRAIERGGVEDHRLRAQPVYDHAHRLAATVVVAESTAAVTRLQQEVLVGSVVVAALILLAGGLAIRNAVGGALEPVAAMTAAARDWGAHDLERRFALGPPRDELTGLASTLDGLLARIAASRRHEQRFASEVAHELRTPLAALRGRAELALAGDEAEREAALRSAVEQAQRLDAAVDALLAVARQELGDAGATADVEAVVRELEDVELVVEGPLPAAEGDDELVRRALAPLVENARRHARGVVTVELGSDEQTVRVTVRDDGPGLDPALRDRVFEPGFQGAPGPGAGLGLPLARRLAAACGGDVVAGDGPGGCFVLSLPRADR